MGSIVSASVYITYRDKIFAKLQCMKLGLLSRYGSICCAVAVVVCIEAVTAVSVRLSVRAVSLSCVTLRNGGTDQQNEETVL